MSSKLNPYLSFAGNAREAMEFYKSVFGGDLNVTTFGDFGRTDPNEANRVMHSALESPNGYTLYAADAPPDMPLESGSQITVSLSGDDESDLRGYWDKLSANGKVTMPLEHQAWGDDFGMCTDQYGINWMVDISHPL